MKAEAKRSLAPNERYEEEQRNYFSTESLVFAMKISNIILKVYETLCSLLNTYLFIIKSLAILNSSFYSFS